jgi:hypothetical protein
MRRRSKFHQTLFSPVISMIAAGSPWMPVDRMRVKVGLLRPWRSGYGALGREGDNR